MGRSFAEISAPSGNVGFTPRSRHQNGHTGMRLSAINDQNALRKSTPYSIASAAVRRMEAGIVMVSD